MAGTTPQDELLASLQQSVYVIDKLESELARGREEIAIIGMSCRFPSADGTAEFWRLLREGRDAITEVPLDRWDMAALYDPDPAAEGKLYSRHGGFVDGVDRFDPLFFGISPKEAARLDPQHRMLLEVAWESLEDAGHAPRTLRGSRTGVYVGIAENDYARLVEEAHGTRLDHYDATGTGFCFASGRISHVLGLQGPNMAMDTGCSSSLVALHQAVSALRLGECELALAGGVHLRLSPTTSLSLARTGALAPDGRCKTFDARADGFGRSEGCGMVVLKRLSDARRDGDTVLAVVRGSAVNHDGPASGFTVPNQSAQISLIRDALANADVEPDEVSFVETHGTGTALGDPIEVGALAEVFGRSPHPVVLGAVKSNIGHTEGAAGIAGVIKTVLALRHGEIPGNVHFTEPNPHVDWAELPFTVPTAPTGWPSTGGARVAGISSFGMSGTNAHIVLAAAPEEAAPEAAAPAAAGSAETGSEEAGSGEAAAPGQPVGPEESGRPLHVLALSGRTEKALAEAAGRMAGFLAGDADGVPLDDVCFTANTGRDHFEHRLAVVAATPGELAERLTSANGATGYVPAHRPVPAVALLFTGQGAQYRDMARELYATRPVFRAAVDRCAALFDRHLDRPLLSVLHPEDTGAPADGPDGPVPGRGPGQGPADLVDRTEYTQPALFTVEYALAELWRSFGVTPDVVLGHSIGGIVAACVAGVFTLEDATLLVAERGRLMGALPDGGAMVSLRAEEAVVAEAVAPHPLVSIAAVNAPGEVVVSGAADQVESVVAALAAQGVKARRLSVSGAFHSPLMAPVAEGLREVARRLRYSPPRITVVSDLTGAPAEAEELCDPEYWVRHALEPVRFADAVRSAHAVGARVFVEAGPKPVLLGLGRACLPDDGSDNGTSGGDEDTAWVPSLRPGRERSALLSAVAALHVRGVPVDWAAVDGRAHPRRVPLPTYPFQRERHWFTAPPQAAVRAAARVRPLLDTRVRLPQYRATVFQTELGTATLPFLGEHRVGGSVVSPGACHLAMAASAAEAAHGGDTVVLRDVVFPGPLVLPDDGTRTVQLVLSPAPDTAEREFQLLDAAGETEEGPEGAADAAVFASGRVVVDAPVEEPGTDRALDTDAVRDRLGREIGRDALYARLAAHGIELGPLFRRLDRIWADTDEVLATVTPAEPGTTPLAPVHPGLLDALFQATEASALASDAPDEARLPFAVERLVVRPGADERAHWIHARRAADGRWDITLLDTAGTPLVEVRGFEDRPVPRGGLTDRAGEWADWLVGVEWSEVAEEGLAGGLSGRWCVVGGSGGSGGVDLGSGVSWVGEVAEAEHVLFVASSADKSADESADGDVAGRGLSLSVGLLELVQRLSACAVAPRLYVVTSWGQAVRGSERPDPAQGALWGLVRTVQAEHPELRCVVVDGDGVVPLERLLCTGLPYSAVRGGVRLRPELTPAADPSPDPAPSRLVLGEYGGPEYLRSEPVRRRAPEAGEVEIEVRAAGLNFRDVLISLGMMRDHYAEAYGLEDAKDIPLGFECAGVVTAVGSEVTGFAVGDAVMAMTEGGFADCVTVPAGQVALVPDGLSLTEAATIPLAFLTAHYALARLARVGPGDRVLVHAASGGVGGAAVQIARALGAEVYATAAAGKRDAVRALGVTHVLDSRSTSFADELPALTGGKGVDVVLNSLNGDFIPAGLSVLAPGGRFVEMGKLGIWSPDRMREARSDVGYFPFDLGDDAERDHTLLPGLFRELGELFASGALRPLPLTVFPRRDAARAYTHMQHTRHTGKVVLTFDRPVRLSSDGVYLITGGLGGLGLAVARRLAGEGAGHVVLAGRGAGGPSAAVREAVEGIEGLGARVHLVAADVSVPGEVERLVERVCAVGPLRGVVHAAGVLDDGVLGAQSAERFGRVFGAKAGGAAELDRVLRARRIPLDFFVAFSSVAALLEDGGQGNYAAANAFLDTLMARRRADGLPGLAVNWGPWAEVGMAAHLADRMARTGTAMIPPEQGLDAFVALLGAPVAQIGVMPTVGRHRPGRTGPAAGPAAATGAVAGPGEGTTAAAPADTWRTRLAQTPPAERPRVLRGYLERQLITLMELPAGYRVDGHTTFAELGMDSLMVVELRNRLQRDLEVPLGSTVAFNHPTVEQLQAHLEEQLGLDPKPGDSDTPGTPGTPGGPAAVGHPDSPAAADADSPDALPLDDLRALVDRELDLLLNDDEDATP